MTRQETFGEAIWLSAGEYERDYTYKVEKTPYFPILRSHFTLHGVRSATLRVVGLGYFHAYINGREVTADQFLPLSTDYEKRNDHPTGETLHGHRLYVPEFDVKDLLCDGENLLAVHFGGGWYTYPGSWYAYNETNDWLTKEKFGNPKVIYALTVEDDTGVHVFVSSEKDKIGNSFVKTYHLTNFECQDFSQDSEDALGRDFDDAAWAYAKPAKEPETDYLFTDCPADRTVAQIKPTLLGKSGDETCYDAGANLTGYPILLVKEGTKGQIIVTFSEEKTETGAPEPSRSHKQNFTFVCDGKARTVYPRFTWFGFRYFSVKGDAEVASVALVHANIPVNSTFESDSEVLNWIYHTYLHTELCNMHGGIPSDCPHIERRGYTGDGQLTCRSGMQTLDSEKFYRKWIGDISDCQDDVSGHVQYTAPYTRCGGGPGAWGCAIVEVPYRFYLEYGDKEPMARLYPQMLRYFDYLEAHSENLLVTSDKAGEWCLGDWCTPAPVLLPAPFVNNYYYIKSLEHTIAIARLIGREADIPDLERRLSERRAATQAAYFNTWDANFLGDLQGANAFAFDAGIGNKRTFENLVKDYRVRGYYDTGICGIDVLTRVLFETGNGDVATRLLLSEHLHSFAEWKKRGFTTFSEYWAGGTADRSHFHPMFGSVVAYMFEYLLGIRQEAGSAGYEKLLVAPYFDARVGKISGSRMIPAGEVKVAYERTADGVKAEITLPKGKSGKFVYGKTERVLSEGKNEFVVEV